MTSSNERHVPSKHVPMLNTEDERFRKYYDMRKKGISHNVALEQSKYNYSPSQYIENSATPLLNAINEACEKLGC